VVTLLPNNTTDIHGSSLTQDELEIYFSCAALGEASFHIWHSTRSSLNAAWNTATMVNEITGIGSDQDPDVSGDGLTLYFASDRAGEGYQLYVSRRDTKGQQWRSPGLVEVEGLTSSTLDVRGPSVDPNELFMTFLLGSTGHRELQTLLRVPYRPAGSLGKCPGAFGHQLKHCRRGSCALPRFAFHYLELSSP